MKTLTTLIVALLAVAGANAQSWNNTFGVNYGFTLPRGGMKPYIRNGNGVMMNFLAEAPSRRIAAGLEFNYTGYGHSKRNEDYTFPDGTSAPMNIVVNNSFMSLMATTRLYFVLDGPVRPYATVKAGYTWFITNLTINDPDDTDSCTPVESDMLQKDGTFAYSAGGGVRFDLAWIFKKKLSKGYYFLDISSNVLQGGRVNYMNEDAPDPQSSHNMSTRAKDVEAQFVNTQTQVVHSHHVGYLYNSFVSMMDFRLGFSMRILH
jgi:opacity protein-like surface antigen